MTASSPPTAGCEAPTWLRCASCGAVDELRLGPGTGDEILCKRCRRHKRSGPVVDVYTYHIADRDVVQLMVERKVRGAFDRFGERLERIVVKFDLLVPTGKKRCRMFVSGRDQTQLAAECIATTLDTALARAADLLNRRLEQPWLHRPSDAHRAAAP